MEAEVFVNFVSGCFLRSHHNAWMLSNYRRLNKWVLNFFFMGDDGGPQMGHAQGLPSHGSQAGEGEKLDTYHSSSGDQSCDSTDTRDQESPECR